MLEGRTYGILLLNATPHKKVVNASMYEFFIDEASSYFTFSRKSPTLTVSWSQGKSAARKDWDAFDLWKDAELTTTIKGGESLSVEVPSHGVRVFKLVEASSARSLRFEL